MPKFGGPQVVQLPSGARVRVRRMSLLSRIAAGDFPADLTTAAWKMYSRAEASDGKDAITVETIREQANVVEKYLPYVLVSPKIGNATETSEDAEGVVIGTVAIADIPDIDKQYLVMYGQGYVSGSFAAAARPEAGLDSFRDGAARADAGPSGDEIRAATVGADRPSAVEPAGA